MIAAGDAIERGRWAIGRVVKVVVVEEEVVAAEEVVVGRSYALRVCTRYTAMRSWAVVSGQRLVGPVARANVGVEHVQAQ